MVPSVTNSSLSLHQVVLMFRHGDRTIAGSTPCWPNDTAVYKCTLTDTSIPNQSRTSTTTNVNRLYRKVYMDNRNYFPGNCMTGQLTDRGYHQEVENGAMYRDYLVEKLNFMPSSFNPNEVFARADDQQRVIQSLESFLLGMYPPGDNEQQIMNIHTMDYDNDTMTINTAMCPAWNNYYNAMKTSPEYLEHLQKYTYPLIEKLEAVLGVSGMKPNDLDHLFDCMTVHLCHEFGIPVSYELYELVKAEANWQKWAQYTYPNRTVNSQVGIGFLIQEMYEWMELGVSGQQFPKMVLVAGHDTTLMPIMAAFGVYQPAWVPYASRVSWEVYKDGSGAFHVRMLFMDKVLDLPGADAEGIVSWEKFMSIVRPLLPVDPAITCFQ